MDNKRDIKEQVTLKNNKSSELEINRPLTYYECVQLLRLCVENGLIERDREHDSNILVYRERGTESPEGWYSENLMSIAKDLSNDFDGQKTLMEELKSQGINIEFHEPAFACNFCLKPCQERGKYMKTKGKYNSIAKE